LSKRATALEFQPAIDRLRTDVTAFLAMNLKPPELPGGYYHDYICPEHGEQLLFRADQPTRHVCPVDGAVFEGERFDSAWRWFVNHELSENALRMAVLHRVEGSLLGPLREILLCYAERYATYAVTPRTGINPGVATYTTLDESVWSIPLAWAYSLIEDELTAVEREQIETKLFLPAAEHLVKRHYRGIHNFSCWHNAAIATLGRVCGRPDLVAGAIDTASGQRAQLRRGMLADGLWWEGSMSYHFYALWAVLVSALAARHTPELDIFADPSIHRALRTMIDCAYPDGTLPATHDCWYFTSVTGEACHGVPPGPDFYEIGFAAYGDAAFAAVLNRTDSHGRRDSVYALLLGAEQIPNSQWPERRSLVLGPSGLAFLRPAGSNLDLMLKFGPTGDHHGHPDKLAITGYANGWRFSPDLGTPGYGVASLESWYRQTLSHNAVLIDGLSQPPAEGALVRFAERLVEAAVEWTEDHYAGVSMRRCIFAQAEYFVDIFTVRCDRPRRIEWVYHNAGRADLPAGEPALLEGSEQYQHLEDVRRLTGVHRVDWKDVGGAMSVWLAPFEGEEVYAGQAPGHPAAERWGFVLRQRHATEATFVAVLHPHHGEARVRGVDWQGNRFAVQLVDRRDEFDLLTLISE